MFKEFWTLSGKDLSEKKTGKETLANMKLKLKMAKEWTGFWWVSSVFFFFELLIVLFP